VKGPIRGSWRLSIGGQRASEFCHFFPASVAQSRQSTSTFCDCRDCWSASIRMSIPWRVGCNQRTVPEPSFLLELLPGAVPGVDGLKNPLVPNTRLKEKGMTRIVVFAAGVAAGVIGTLVVEKPTEVEKLRAVAAAVRKKIREILTSDQQDPDAPVHGIEGTV
jgi:hypothetical protein